MGPQKTPDIKFDVDLLGRTKVIREYFFQVFRNQEVMKRGEMQKKNFDFWTDYHTFRSIELLF